MKKRGVEWERERLGGRGERERERQTEIEGESDRQRECGSEGVRE